jgi:hypothetical protein
MVLLYRISYLDICMVLLCDVPAPSVRPPERERERGGFILWVIRLDFGVGFLLSCMLVCIYYFVRE